MGCLRALFVQVGCLVLIVAAAVFAFLYRDRLWDAYRRYRGERPAAETVYMAPAPGGARHAEEELARLGRRGGPAYVDLTAADLAGLLDRELVRASRGVFDSVRVALDSDLVLVHGLLDLSQLPRGVLGPFAGSFSGREPLEAGGALSAGVGGGVRWQPTRLRVRDFPFPRRTIPALLRALHLAVGADGALTLPGLGGVGDVRVSRERVRLYRLERP